MDFRTIQLDRVEFDSPNKKRVTWKSSIRYGSEKRIVFQTPPFRASVAQHKFLPDALTLQKSSTVNDLAPFSEFLDSVVSLFDASVGNGSPDGRSPLDYLTIGSDTVVYGVTDALQPGDSCKVACLVALTGGWCKPSDDGAIVSRGLTFEVDEVKVYELAERVVRAPRTFIDGVEVTRQN